jgi:hypothetical protein
MLNLSDAERETYERTGQLPVREQQRISRESIERTRAANERLANLDPRKDPTRRDSVHLPAGIEAPSYLCGHGFEDSDDCVECQKEAEF